MADETMLLNDALGAAGGCQPITAIDDGSDNANHCKTFYPTLRDGLLRAHFWNFALKWVELAQDATAPALGYNFSYTLPPDFLRVKQYAGNAPSSVTGFPTFADPTIYRNLVNYKIEGRFLRSNDGQAFIQYIQRIENPDLWDTLFYQALVLWLGSKLALAIRKDIRMSSGLLQQFQTMMLPLALAVDGQEGSIEAYIVDDLLWGRR